MLRLLRAGQQTIETVTEPMETWSPPADAAWIDLHNPTLEEERRLEAVLGFGLPTREDMVEIEASSRLYQHDGATFMTAQVLCNSEGDLPNNEPLTFVLTAERLITIRYASPKSLELYEAQLARQVCVTGAQVFLGLLDVIVDRTADILERDGAEIEEISGVVFSGRPKQGFRRILQRLGRAQYVNAKVRDSLVTLARLVSFASLADAIEADREARSRLRTLSRDIASITEHGGHLSGQTVFLLDAALGQINIEQNDIIKMFSVMAVAFMPPTLVASIYGMNFHHMPELSWQAGYPMAIGAMVVSAAVPLWWFNRRGWL